MNTVELIGTYGDDELIACSAWTNINKEFKNKYSISGIYAIANKVNNKLYIGSSFNIYKRIIKHLLDIEKNRHINHHLISSFKTYGIDKFEIKILYKCRVDYLLFFEDYFINKYQSNINKNGYNQTLTSYSPFGYRHTEEVKAKMKNLKLGSKLTKEHIDKIVNNRKGYRHSKETKIKISIKNSGINNGMYGKKEDEDHKQKRMKNFLNATKWNKGRNKNNDEKVKLLSLKLKGRKVHNSIKCKLSNIQTGISYESDSLKNLSIVSGISLSTINRIKNNTCGLKIKNMYKLEIL